MEYTWYMIPAGVGGFVFFPANTVRLECCLAVLQEATSLKSGTVLEKDTGVIVLTRYAGLSDEFFTRATDFVPER